MSSAAVVLRLFGMSLLLRRRLLLAPATPLSLLRRSGTPLPAPSRLPLPLSRRGASWERVSSVSTSSFGFGGCVARSSPPFRCFASSSSQTYSFTPSGAMQSVRVSAAGDIAVRIVIPYVCIYLLLRYSLV
jgi:hypothetical protein